LPINLSLWFIPPSEPWWNGVVEHRHNSAYRYSKIKGKTSLKALAGMEKKLIFPSKSDAPRYPLDKPEEGCYHLARFIRSDCLLNIFGEMFPVPPETQYEYVAVFFKKA